MLLLKGQHTSSPTLSSSTGEVAQKAPRIYEEELNSLTLGQNLEGQDSGQLSLGTEELAGTIVPLLTSPPNPVGLAQRVLS